MPGMREVTLSYSNPSWETTIEFKCYPRWLLEQRHNARMLLHEYWNDEQRHNAWAISLEAVTMRQRDALAALRGEPTMRDLLVTGMHLWALGLKLGADGR